MRTHYFRPEGARAEKIRATTTGIQTERTGAGFVECLISYRTIEQPNVKINRKILLLIVKS